MRKSRRLAAALAVSALVAAGGITVGLVANANEAGLCSPAAVAMDATCTINTQTINTPTAMSITVTLGSTAGGSISPQDITVTWQGDCSQGTNDEPISSPTTPVLTPVTAGNAVSINVPFPTGMTTPDACDITATGTLSSTGTFEMVLNWTPSATPSATTTASSTTSPPVNVSLIRGYGGKCVDDKGNSSSNGSAVIIWSCNSGDSAQGWTFSGGELKHNGKCANDQGNGGSGSKVILWSCNGASNEKWFHSGSDGEFILSLSSHGLLCLNDPAYSKSNGTRLIVYKCQNTSNEHWT
jgi:hypothetical protein